MLEDSMLSQLRMQEQELQIVRMFQHENALGRQQQEFLLEAQRIHHQQESFVHAVAIKAMEEDHRRLLPFLQAHERQTAWMQMVGLDSRTIEQTLRTHEDFTRCTRWFVLDVLGKRGWIGLERLLSNEVFPRLFWLIHDEGKRAADLFICNEFRKRRFEQLRLLVKDWLKVPYLKKRKLVFRAAIRAHREAKYALSIPALFPFVDGLTLELASTFPAKYGSATTIKKLAAVYMKRGQPTWFLDFEEAVNSSFYKQFNPLGAVSPPCGYNRHGVMHGRTVHYASEPNSLRVILLINVLVTIFSVESKATRRRGKALSEIL